jgi:hypothetical protein
LFDTSKEETCIRKKETVIMNMQREEKCMRVSFLNDESISHFFSNTFLSEEKRIISHCIKIIENDFQNM